MVISENSSVGKLQSFNKALVSTSELPMVPSSSTRVPKGWSEVLQIAHQLCAIHYLVSDSHRPSLDCSHEELVTICVGVVDEIGGSLFRRNGN